MAQAAAAVGPGDGRVRSENGAGAAERMASVGMLSRGPCSVCGQPVLLSQVWMYGCVDVWVCGFEVCADVWLGVCVCLYVC